ncbi:MAG TPA: multicopper oxidase domain-containing protein [Solirubrobacteraceae bacterium]|nr:multicopper oxidase domain-containing protein [Solirubrobacteraceae bacterium]
MELSRRDLVKLGILGGAAMYLPVERMARARDWRSDLRTPPKPYAYYFQRPPEIDLRAAANGEAISNLRFGMQEVSVSLLGSSAPNTKIWAYVAEHPVTKQKLINPTIHVDKGQPVEFVHGNYLPPGPGAHPFVNLTPHADKSYPSWTSVHLHGSASLPQYDGYANDLINPGQLKRYRYPNGQGARTLWYHDHGVHHTSLNAYAGLAAQYHLHDDMERDSGIPTGAFDFPLILKDALFARDGRLQWDDNDLSSFMGDVIFVNGVPWPLMPVHKRKYRFRILNASISRSFNLSLSGTGATMHVIATDGGFMPKPVKVTSLRVGMAERYEIVVDFEKCADNAEILLRSAEVKNNVDYLHTGKIMKWKVQPGVAPDKSRNELPTQFYTPRAPNAASNTTVDGVPRYMGPDEIMGLTESMAVRRRKLEFKKSDLTGEWLIGNKTWKEVEDSDYQAVVADPKVGDIEVWDLENSSGGWFHPVHLHLVDFKILSRNGRAPHPYEQGPKDVAYVGEGETVRIVAKFGPHEGRYMIHCHNLVHEDHDMMTQYRVGPQKANADDPNDPRYGDPAWGDANA